MQLFYREKGIDTHPPLIILHGLWGASDNWLPVADLLSHLPVIVDPSHATGIARLVRPMALAAAACGSDGLIIEVHNDPIHALCDGAQSLRPEQYDDLAKAVRRVREAVAE